MTLAATILVWRATRAVKVANTHRRRRIAAELADYSSDADRQDFEAVLDRHPDAVTAEMRDILAHQRMWAAYERSASSPFGRPPAEPVRSCAGVVRRAGSAHSLRGDRPEDVHPGRPSGGPDRSQHADDCGEHDEHDQLAPGDGQHRDAVVGQRALHG